jgi:hypothetical protein
MRLLRAHGLATLPEVALASGRRADIVALSETGEIGIVEVKSCLADFRADAKWPEYRDVCDRLWFAVGVDFPAHVLPETTGLILADGYGAEIVRVAPVHRLASARRKAIHLRFARTAAERLASAMDPMPVGLQTVP